jgi:hypothetical protein
MGRVIIIAMLVGVMLVSGAPHEFWRLVVSSDDVS